MLVTIFYLLVFFLPLNHCQLVDVLYYYDITDRR